MAIHQVPKIGFFDLSLVFGQSMGYKGWLYKVCNVKKWILAKKIIFGPTVRLFFAETKKGQIWPKMAQNGLFANFSTLAPKSIDFWSKQSIFTIFLHFQAIFFKKCPKLRIIAILAAFQ